MINIIMTKSQYRVFNKVMRHSKQSGHSWFSYEAKKMLYLKDKSAERNLRALHNQLFEMATRWEEERNLKELG